MIIERKTLEKVVVIKVNDVYLKILCEPSLEREISDRFCFKAKNFQFSPKHKKGHWDGSIRLFSLRTKQLYIGLLPQLIDYLKENGSYEITVPRIVDHPKLTLEQLEGFIKTLNIPAKFANRDYQLDALLRAINSDRMVLLCPTSSGKSLIIYILMRFYNAKGLVIVPTTNLVRQMYTDFEEYGFDSAKHIKQIMAGENKILDKKYTISTWQSIQDTDARWFEPFRFVVVDECHLAEAKKLTGIMENCVNARYRFGTTGTLSDLDSSKTAHMALEGLFGEIYQPIKTHELIKQGYSSPLDVKVLILSYPPASRIIHRDYQEEVAWLTEHDTRNRYIANLTVSLKGNTLVLFNYIEHGKLLYELIQKRAADKQKSEFWNVQSEGRKIYLIYSKVESLDREKIREIVNKEKDAIIVASFGTMSLGVNIVNLHNVIIGSIVKSSNRLLQSIGRGLRLGENKTHCTVYDFADDLSYFKSDELKLNYSLQHLAERRQVYIREKFPFKILKIDI